MPRWVWIGLVANILLWLVGVAAGQPVSEGPMLMTAAAEAGKAPDSGSGNGVGFELRSCFDCPEYVLLGREIGGNTSLLWFLPGLLNAPAFVLGAGQEVGLGMRELSLPTVLATILIEWLLAGLIWRLWRLKGRAKAAAARVP